MMYGDLEQQDIRINGIPQKLLKEKQEMVAKKYKHESLESALAAAQANIGGAIKGSANPFFKSKYADLGSVIEAVKEAVNAEGLAILQPVACEIIEGKPVQYLDTILVHESGQQQRFRAFLPTIADIQKQGAAITYMRRFALQSLLLVPAEDTDGEALMDRAPKPNPKAPGEVKPKPAFLKGK